MTFELFAQVPVGRKVIEHGMFVKHCKVEVYLMDLKLCPNKNLDQVVTKHFSRADTIGKFITAPYCKWKQYLLT